MTATPAVIGGWKPASDHNPIPGALARPLAASEQVGRGQFVTVDPSTGYARLNDGTVPFQVASGQGDYSEMSDKDATAANAWVRLSERHFSGLPGTGTTTDTFTVADWAVPFYIATENTLGKLSHTGADATLANRTLGGLVFGVDKVQGGTPYAWTGPIAWLLARSALVTNSFAFGRHSLALTQGATQTEIVIPRNGMVHGKVTKVRVARAVAGTDGDTDSWTFTVAKRTSTTPGTAVSVAAKATKTTAGIGAMAAYVYYDLTLTLTDADLGLLEDDTLTLVATAATGSSPAITQLTVEVIGKVA
jgi:hypothetical protein